MSKPFVKYGFEIDPVLKLELAFPQKVGYRELYISKQIKGTFPVGEHNNSKMFTLLLVP